MGQELIPAGLVVAPERVVRAVDVALDGGSVADIFTISGGPIQLLALILEITEAVSVHACAMKLALDAVVAAMDIDITGATGDINGTTLGSFWSVTGDIAVDLLEHVAGTAIPLGLDPDFPLIVPPGGIDQVLANSDPTSGIGTWYMRYKPLSEDAMVVGS